jgi:PAS domain S-box-containing protein
MHASPIAISLWCGPDYTLLYNDAYRRILGVKHPMALGRSGAEVWDELWPALEEQFTSVRNGGAAVFEDEALLTMERLEGGKAEDAWFTYSLSALIDESGQCLAVFNTAVEVTKKVLAHRELEYARRTLAESESRLREEVARSEEFAATLEQATDFIGIATPDGRAHYVNPAGLALMGLDSEEEAKKTMVIDYFAPDWVSRVRDELIPILVREGHWRGEVMFKHFKTGELIPAEWNAFAVKDKVNGEVTALACVARDLRVQHAINAERTHLLQAAENARAEAEHASRAKSEFLAVMSHELRTPLNAIGGYAELLEMGIRGPITPQQADDLHRIQSSQRHLLGLINEVLNHARLETGSVHYDIADVWLGDAFQVAEGLVAPQARAKGLKLVIAECTPGMMVRADADKLQQILLNLLSNAVKFTDAGGEISLSCETMASDTNQIAIRVHDSGIGIPADKIDMVFDPFVQVDSRLTRTAEGTGLGLAISRDLARGMGGELRAESVYGKGSTFTLELPRA